MHSQWGRGQRGYSETKVEDDGIIVRAGCRIMGDHYGERRVEDSGENGWRIKGIIVRAGWRIRDSLPLFVLIKLQFLQLSEDAVSGTAVMVIHCVLMVPTQNELDTIARITRGYRL